MSKTSRLFLITTVILLSLACNTLTRPWLATPQPAANALPKLEGNWVIHMNQSGGIMGLNLEMELASNGQLSVLNQRKNQKDQAQISAEQLDKLTALIAEANYQLPKNPHGACADCFVYSLEITTDTQKFNAQLDDTNLADSGLEPLIKFLREMMNATLKNAG